MWIMLLDAEWLEDFSSPYACAESGVCGSTADASVYARYVDAMEKIKGNMQQ